MEAWRMKVDGFKASVHELGVVVEGEVLQVVEPPKKTNTSQVARADSNTNCCRSETAICDVEERDRADQIIKAAASHSMNAGPLKGFIIRTRALATRLRTPRTPAMPLAMRESPAHTTFEAATMNYVYPRNAPQDTTISSVVTPAVSSLLVAQSRFEAEPPVWLNWDFCKD